MKVAEIRSLSDEELNAKLKELKSELFNLRFAQATGSLTNPMQLHNIKKDIAKINTILRERRV
ncbi:MAG: 50S ribosomal protein L29 [Clostridia bacterium]|nr:50S ribosomal protein L29 [Clostridia bacterium]